MLNILAYIFAETLFDMKTIKSALLGTRQLIDTNQEVLLVQITQILKEHRAIIITRLISDLPTYLDYKFQLSKPSKEELSEIKDKLLSLKNSGIGLKHFSTVVNEVQQKNVVHLTNEPFYTQIDEYLKPYINTPALKFA